MSTVSRLGSLVLLSASFSGMSAASAGDRLLATGGVMQIEGSAGGGLTPWAVIAGLGTRDQIGASAFCTQVHPQDFDLRSCGLAVGFYDRVELSFAQQRFGLGSTVPGESIEQRVLGVKVKLAGDAVYDQDKWLPQIAVGAQFKKNLDFTFVPQLLGARDDSGVDYYLAATKVWLSGIAGRTTLLSATLRATKANQFGILGFGGDRDDGYAFVPESSIAMFMHDHVVLGAEYRVKPDHLSAFREDDFWDGFVAWVPLKNVSLTLAYAQLGNIADKDDQHGWYASLQTSF